MKTNIYLYCLIWVQNDRDLAYCHQKSGVAITYCQCLHLLRFYYHFRACIPYVQCDKVILNMTLLGTLAEFCVVNNPHDCVSVDCGPNFRPACVENVCTCTPSGECVHVTMYFYWLTLKYLILFLALTLHVISIQES